MQPIQKKGRAFTRPISFIIVGVVIAMTVVAASWAETDISKQPHYVTVTYFHSSFRCVTCRKIEESSAEIIKNNFADELNGGTLIWRSLNVDEPENKHYTNDYQLYTKSLIISEIQNGKEIRWKNLEKIWTYIKDDAQFEQYIQSEVHDWIKK